MQVFDNNSGLLSTQWPVCIKFSVYVFTKIIIPNIALSIIINACSQPLVSYLQPALTGARVVS